jgi:hypothetical protein
VLRDPAREPALLLKRLDAWRRDPRQIPRTTPSMAFAVVGQARAAGVISPADESRLLGDLLTAWAVRSSLDQHLLCASPARPRLSSGAS